MSHCARLYYCPANVPSRRPDTTHTHLGCWARPRDLLWSMESEWMWHLGPKLLGRLCIYGSLFELLFSTMRTKFPTVWRLLEPSPGMRKYYMEQT